MASEGFVYVATGEAYLKEARAAAASLRAHHPAAPICLVTDRPPGEPFWDDLAVIPHPVYGLRDKIEMCRCPYEKFVFLDADTTVLADLGELFLLLDAFDCLGHQLFEGHDYRLEGVPDAFPEFNTGVLGFRRGPKVEALFSSWAQSYDRYRERNRDGFYHYSNVSDQKSFKEAVYRSEVRVAVLGPEFNFVPHHTNFACSSVKVLHSRQTDRIPSLERRLNRKVGTRAYVPRLDAVVSNDPPGSELVRLWAMTSLQLLRYAVRRLLPGKLRGRLRSFSLVRRLFLRDMTGSDGK